jgi:simple sugar transport system ATP-binding protein
MSEKFGLQIDPYAKVGQLSVGEQQRIEIAKVLYRNVKILILDEPTSMLTPQESRELFKFIRSLVDQGISVIFVTHKMNEVLAVSDNISVLCKGRNVCTVKTSETDEASLIKSLFGEEHVMKC